MRSSCWTVTGAQRTEVTVETGEGRETVEMSWRERESTRETEEPEANAKRPEGLRSAADWLLRFGGPGRILSEDEEHIFLYDILVAMRIVDSFVC